MKSKQPRKLSRIKAKFLLKRWEEYGITKEEIVWLIKEGDLTVYDRNSGFYKVVEELDLLLPGRRDDELLEDISFDLSELEESEDEILKALRPNEYLSVSKKIEDATKQESEKAEEVSVDNKDKEIEKSQKSKRTAEFDEAVLELIKSEPEISKTEIIQRLKDFYPAKVTPGAMRKHFVKLQKEHDIYRIEKPGVKKRT